MDEKEIINLIKEANKIGLKGRRIIDIVRNNQELKLVVEEKDIDPYNLRLEDWGG